MCRSAVIFGTLKDDSLRINISALNNCFSHRNVFQNGINTLSKNYSPFFVKKHKILYGSDHTIFVQISPASGPNTYQIMYGETLDF